MRLSRPSRGALAFLGQQARYRGAQDARGQLLFLLRTGLVIVPERRGRRGWTCLVVCGPRGETTRRRMAVADVEIETALRLCPPDPVRGLEVGSFATMWQARVWDRWPKGTMPRLAAALAELMVGQHSHVVALDLPTVERILTHLNLDHSGMRRLLARLVQGGLLTPISHDPVSGSGRFLVLLGDSAAMPSRGVGVAAVPN